MKYSIIRITLGALGMTLISVLLEKGFLSAEYGMIAGFMLGGSVYSLVRDEKESKHENL
jgi:hypothetical protein